MTAAIRRARVRPELRGHWDGPAWAQAETLEISHFRPEGSCHRPRTQARLLYDAEEIYAIFQVEDRYVRSVRTRYLDPVYEDSCVELFLQPQPGRGYLNFEVNAGGTLLAGHVLDPTRTPAGLKDFRPLGEAPARSIRIFHSLPGTVDPEVTEAVTWLVELHIPVVLLSAVAGACAPSEGAEWRGNLHKCADETSHPHWASWSPLSERNFHLPGCFGVLRFA